jgi:uncharacterized protein YmfQ (DUF2313 family)
MEVEAAAVRVVSAQAPRVAGQMNPQAVSNTLWGIAKLAENGVEVDAAAMRTVSEQAPRVAGQMIPQEVSNTLWAIAKLAEKGVEVDAAAMRAVSAQAPRVAGQMKPQHVSNTLWAIAKLAEKGVEVDAAAMRAVSEQAPRVAGEMIPQAVSNTLWAWSRFVESGIQLSSIIDESSWRTVVARAKEVWPQTSAQDRGMIQRAMNIITTASTAEETMSKAADTSLHPPPEYAPAAFWAAAKRWLSKLPEGKRAKLESNLSAAETDDAKRQLLVASVEADTTKVRAADKQAFLKVAAAKLAEP